jgi:Uma2 family endonuclease
MATVYFRDAQLSIPSWVKDIETFRRWAHSDEFPEEWRIWWLCGEVWAEMAGEQIFSHVLVKTRISTTLDTLTIREECGLYLTDGVLLSNFAADVSGVPDGMFLSNDTLRSDRIRLIEGKKGGYVELQGAPDMVLEILSDSSEEKDNVILKDAYFQGGIPEYWLIDARTDPPRFDLFRRSARGYVATRRQKEGWLKSGIFGRSFRLTRQVNALGHPAYTLEVRPVP